jgi:hypothetical protein
VARGRGRPFALNGPRRLLASASDMRRQTLIMIVVLFLLIGAAAVAQIVIVSGDGQPLPGPASPGELPSPSASAPG